MGDPPAPHSARRSDLSCRACTVKLQGRLSDGLALLEYLTQLDLSYNALAGTLPEAWGAPHSFMSLLELLLNGNQIVGTIPDAWGVGPAFNALANMQLANNRLTASGACSRGRQAP